MTVKTSRLMFSCKAPYTENSPFLLPSCHNPTIEVPGNLRKKNENRSSIDVIDVMLFFFFITADRLVKQYGFHNHRGGRA